MFTKEKKSERWNKNWKYFDKCTNEALLSRSMIFASGCLCSFGWKRKWWMWNEMGSFFSVQASAASRRDSKFLRRLNEPKSKQWTLADPKFVCTHWKKRSLTQKWHENLFFSFNRSKHLFHFSLTQLQTFFCFTTEKLKLFASTPTLAVFYMWLFRFHLFVDSCYNFLYSFIVFSLACSTI